MAIASLVAGWPVLVEQAVAWGEMDAFQHVNNVAYFRWFENARIAYMARLGWPDLERETGVGIILASAQARFRKPLSWPDTVVIAARAVAVDADRFTLRHIVVSRTQEAITTEGEGLIVTFDYRQQRKMPLPDLLRQRIAAIEGSALDSSGAACGLA